VVREAGLSPALFQCARGSFPRKKRALFRLETDQAGGLPPVFLRFDTFYYGKALAKKEPFRTEQRASFPAENGQFYSVATNRRRGFSWFFCGKKGVPGRPQKNRQTGLECPY
jgi:hypothetical protein